MIPYIIVIIGILLATFGSFGLLRMAVLPYTRLKKVVYEWEDDILKYASGAGRLEYNRRAKQLAWIYVSSVAVGACCFFLGIYLGYAEKGSSFWFYKQLFGEEIQNDYWDQITEDNKFISSSGNTYTYYILVDEDKYSFCGEECKNIDELKDSLSKIRRENTVILIDSFAISSAYHDAEVVLKELGIKYETEEE